MISGSGAHLYAFANGVFLGGNEAIFGFNTGRSHLLSDNTQIAFVGGASLNTNLFT